MNIYQVLLLAVIEGVTEFLPISSTGHLIIVTHLLKIVPTDFIKSFEIFIQLGAICAVVVLYFKYLINHNNIWKYILFAFLPTLLIGFFSYKFIKIYLLGNSYIVAWSLLIGGLILIIIEKFFKSKNNHIGELSISQSIIIGLFQCLSMIPGVSRSAATIIGALFMGLSKKEAVVFSFILAIPTMIAATTLDMTKSAFFFSSQEISYLFIGFGVSFITALLVIKWFLRIIQKHSLIGFGIYRVIVALFLLKYFI